MIKNIYSALIVLFLAGISSMQAQEYMHLLPYNPTIKNTQEEGLLLEKSQERVLTLPFRDDFSYPGPYPDPGLWADRNVFINNNFAMHPKTVGVATFDAFDESGRLYEHMTSSNTPLEADMLSSHLIRLDSVFAPQPRRLTPTDGVVLSFYYQPQGKAGNPVYQDSLVLQFLHTPGYYVIDDEGDFYFVEDEWRTVWKATGETLSEFTNDTFPYFHRVSIPITDQVYFRNDFRFRFMNHVSFPLPGNPTLQNITGMRSIWNIDYVYLNSGRNPEQTNYFDIAFAAPAQSILSRYSAMPWSHYIVNPQQNLRPNLSMAIANLDQTIYPYSYRYYIQDEAGNIIRNYSGGTWNIAPFATHGYQDYQPHANPIVLANPLPTAAADERHFDIVHVIRAGVAGDSNQRNDTISYRQSFSNFYAYDNGTPEGGYGVIGRFPRIAKRYFAAKADQVTSVDIYFNETINEQNANRPFKITIWKRLAPNEEIIYQSDDAVTSLLSDESSAFFRYELSRAVEVADTFYIGIEQQGNVGINDFISIGFDANNNAGNQLFFNSGAGWLQSIYQGALMIRPVFGSLKADETPQQDEKRQATASIFPNPVSGNQMSVLLEQADDQDRPARMEIFDMYGKVVYAGDYKPYMNTGHMANGIYFLRISYGGGQKPETTRFIIAR